MNSVEDSLLETIAALDETFAADKGSQMGDFFLENARLMWPMTRDIVGREAIRAAFELFTSKFTTLAWQPDRHLLEVHGDSAYVVGRFSEIRRRLDNGQLEQVFGRLVEVWRRDENGRWQLDLLLTSRFAETEILGRE